MTDEKPSYYERNKERILAQRKIYNEENKEKIREYQKEYFQKNKDKFADKNKKWRQAHPVPKKVKKEKQPTLKKNQLPLLPLFVPEPDPEPTVIYTNRPFIVAFD